MNILRCACIAFRKIFHEYGNVCPFRESPKIASACNLFFRRHLLREHTMGIIPTAGYRQGDVQSILAIEWILFMEGELDVEIQHASRGRGHRLHKSPIVDRYFREHDNGPRHVFQFHGCFWHGCKLCNNTRRDHVAGKSGESMNDR